MNLYYINPLLNPGSIDYIDYDINDLNFVSFTPQSGTISTGYLEDYEIETDESLLPLSSTRVDKGNIIPEVFIK